MFQDFDAAANPVVGDDRLRKLRSLMAQLQITVLLVPHNDEQNNEYLPADKERLAWISGFTGSAGCAIITLDDAILFSDGRYTLQSRQQTDPGYWTMQNLTDYPPSKWLKANLTPTDVLGFDPWLHSPMQKKSYESAANHTGAKISPLAENPIDAIWHDRPPTPLEPARIHSFEHSGRLTREKLEDIQAELTSKGADHCVLVDPASVCWLFNIRGADVGHTPITLAHAIVPQTGEPHLFIDKRKLDIETRAFLTQVASMHPPAELEAGLADLSSGAKVMLDANTAPVAFNNIVEAANGTVVDGKDPVALLRAVKNETELAGAKAAHLRDGAAMTTFLAWLDDQPPGTIDEITAAKKLEQIRSDMAGEVPLRDISFDTISGSGPNGAIVHYRVDASTNRTLQEGELYLCDSGGQYDDGTTDITRTIAVGEPGVEERRTYTLVLKGHIAIALARFPEGTRGVDIDVLARIALWQSGFDYAHGTGHGVGSYLAVHEGPQAISRRSMQEFLPGMIVSNEPGYYRTGEFGIRLENLVIVREAMDLIGGDQPMLGFETITLAPFDHRLIEPTIMTDDELHWLNAYHGWVRQQIEPLVDEKVIKWLHQATKPLSRELPAASA